MTTQTTKPKNPAAVALGRLGGSVAGKKRSKASYQEAGRLGGLAHAEKRRKAKEEAGKQ